MLRNVLIGIGVAATVCGLASLATGVLSPPLVFAFWGAVLVACIACERVVYKRTLARSPGPGWQRTPERFVDEQTGTPLTVYIEPASGERAYVRE